MNATATTAPASTGASRRWAKNFDWCQGCGTIETKHKGRGLCITCYAKSPESLARVKAYYLNLSRDAEAKRTEYQRAWVERNREHVRARARAYDDRTARRRRFDIGVEAWYHLMGVWCRCMVVDREGRTVTILLRTGETIRTLPRYLSDTNRDDFSDILGKI